MATHFQFTFTFAGFKCRRTWNCMIYRPRVNATRLPNVHMQEVSTGSVYGAGHNWMTGHHWLHTSRPKSNCLVGQCFDLFSSGWAPCGYCIIWCQHHVSVYSFVHEYLLYRTGKTKLVRDEHTCNVVLVHTTVVRRIARGNFVLWYFGSCHAVFCVSHYTIPTPG